MQATSNTWKSLAAMDGVYVESKAIVNGVEYTDIEPPVITRALMQNGLEVGNVVSAVCQFELDTSASIPKSAEVQIKTRLVGYANDTPTYSEWLPQGTFYVSKRTNDPRISVQRFECYDALLKTNAVWDPASSVWPRTASSVVTEIVGNIGLQLDSRTTIAQYSIGEPDAGTTMRDILGVIAQQNGGNWIVTPENKLRLVPIVDLAQSESADTIIDIDAIINEYYTGEIETITGVKFAVEDEADSIIGDDTGAVVSLTVPGIIAADVAELLIGKTYRPFSYATAYYDIAAELGDYIQCEDAVSVIYAETVTLGTGMHGDISAPDLAEIVDEYPYVGSSDKMLVAAKAYAKEYANDAIDGYDQDLTQQEIFNRLTDNGAAQGMILYNGQLYVNASYMKGGTIDGNLVNAKLLNIVDANGNAIASFDSTIRLGQSTNAHAEIDFNSFEIKSSSSNSFFFAGDIRDANGRAEVSDSFVGDGTKTIFVLSLHATSINEVKINDVATSEWQLNGNRIWLYFTTAPASGAKIIVSYTTEDEAFRYDIGTRMSGSKIGAGSIAVGDSVEASGTGSYAEGQETHATGYMSHSEGLRSEATGYASHAEGSGTTASGEASHAEGSSTTASGNYSHAEGTSAKASGYSSHAEGSGTTASGEASHAEGVQTIADGSCQHVAGKYNVSDPNKIEIIGNGEYGARSNARTLDWSGNEWIAGALSVGNAVQTRANLGITPANIAFIGTNPTGGTSNDTRAWWVSKGTCYAYFSATNQVNGQPNQYGFLISIVNGYEVHQEWWSQPNGAHYYRGGNGNTSAMPGWTANVTGVKGNAESSYRTGNVNLTPANVGASISLASTDTTAALLYNKLKDLETNYPASIRVVNGPMQSLTGKSISGGYGTVVKTGVESGTLVLSFDICYVAGNYRHAFTTRVSQNTITPGAVYRYTGTAVS